MRRIFITGTLLVLSVALLAADVYFHTSLASIIAVSIAVGINLGNILDRVSNRLATKE